MSQASESRVSRTSKYFQNATVGKIVIVPFCADMAFWKYDLLRNLRDSTRLTHRLTRWSDLAVMLSYGQSSTEGAIISLLYSTVVHLCPLLGSSFQRGTRSGKRSPHYSRSHHSEHAAQRVNHTTPTLLFKAGITSRGEEKHAASFGKTMER